MAVSPQTLRFVDLFAGLGGFHVGVSKARGTTTQCVFASEIDPELRQLYRSNFGVDCAGDIRKLRARDIPYHDLLCAGFPCQPFSKAGEQKGLHCGKNGDLFEDHLLRIIKFCRPPLLLLENVPNLERHRNGATWERMRTLLESSPLGYEVQWKVLSPADYGMPQTRERMYIVASRAPGGLSQFRWPRPSRVQPSIYSVLETDPPDAKGLPVHYEEALEVWNEFLRRFPQESKLPGFPIWAMEFGADYPADDARGFPGQLSERQLAKYRGSFGDPLREIKNGRRLESLPPYARAASFPKWKQVFIRQNRELYCRNRRWLNGWKQQLRKFTPSLQKLEWNCQGEARDVWQHVVQFRASGIRVKRTTAAPTLVAMTTTQVPVIASERRYMTVRECARIQRLDALNYLPSGNGRAFQALGNAVNADMVRRVAQALINATEDSRKLMLSDQMAC